MYLTYDEFENMGGSIAEEVFPRFEMKARKRLDAVTFGRLMDENPARECVKMCMCELISAMYEDERVAGASGREVSAVANDGVSVTYASGGGDGAAHGGGARYTGIVRNWLTGEVDTNGVSLIYAGVI